MRRHTTSTSGEAFVLGSERVGQQLRAVSRLACHLCPEVRTAAVPRSFAPEQEAKRAARDGWELDHRRASSVRCPACAIGRNKSESRRAVELRASA